MTAPVAIILGAGIGGSAVARALAPTWHVVLVDRDEARLAALSESIGPSAEWAVVDLLDVEAVTALRDGVLERLGRVDAVVHLIGGWQGSSTVDTDALKAWKAIAPGVFGTVRSTSVVFREALAAAPSGCYVMVSSTAKPTAGNIAYVTAKVAAETWVQGLAHAFRKSSARAVVVAVKALVDAGMRQADPDNVFPGYTDTADLATVIAGVLTSTDTANGARLDLTVSA